MRRSEIPRDIFFSDDDDRPPAEPEASPRQEDAREGSDEAPTPDEQEGDEGQKVQKRQISVYLTKPTAKKLDAVRFRLEYEHDVKLSKSDLAEFAIGRLDTNIDEIIEAAYNGEFDW